MDLDPHTKAGRRALMDKALAHMGKANQYLENAQQGKITNWESFPPLDGVIELYNTLRVLCAVVDVLADEHPGP